MSSPYRYTYCSGNCYSKSCQKCNQYKKKCSKSPRKYGGYNDKQQTNYYQTPKNPAYNQNPQYAYNQYNNNNAYSPYNQGYSPYNYNQTPQNYNYNMNQNKAVNDLQTISNNLSRSKGKTDVAFNYQNKQAPSDSNFFNFPTKPQTNDYSINQGPARNFSFNNNQQNNFPGNFFINKSIVN